MRHRQILCVIVVSVLNALAGCASTTPTVPAEQIIEAFPKPAPLKGTPSTIRLQISSADNELYFVSLDRDSWQDMRLQAHRITMQRGNILLQGQELQWDFGETVVTLRDGKVALDYQVAEGKTSRIVYEPAGNDVNVSENGKWLSRGPVSLIDLAADTGKIVQF